MAKSLSGIEHPVVLLERNLYGHPLAGRLWERQVEEVLLEHGWEKVPKWECMFANREKRLFLSVCGRYKIGWEKAEHSSDLEKFHEKL